MVISIVLEEVEAYYTGKKSLDEVIGIIQNRVQLLLNENMQMRICNEKTFAFPS